MVVVVVGGGGGGGGGGVKKEEGEEEARGRGGGGGVVGGWGTWEELVLGSAVIRHGGVAWGAVAAEVRSRSPCAFSPEVRASPLPVSNPNLVVVLMSRAQWLYCR